MQLCRSLYSRKDLQRHPRSDRCSVLLFPDRQDSRKDPSRRTVLFRETVSSCQETGLLYRVREELLRSCVR